MLVQKFQEFFESAKFVGPYKLSIRPDGARDLQWGTAGAGIEAGRFPYCLSMLLLGEPEFRPLRSWFFEKVAIESSAGIDAFSVHCVVLRAFED